MIVLAQTAAKMDVMTHALEVARVPAQILDAPLAAWNVRHPVAMPVVMDVVATVPMFVVGRVAMLVAIVAGMDVQRVALLLVVTPVVVDVVATVPKFAVDHAERLVATAVEMGVQAIVHRPATMVA